MNDANNKNHVTNVRGHRGWPFPCPGYAKNEIGIAYLPVMDHGQVVGLLTNRDIVERFSAKQIDPSKTQVKDIMKTGQIVCQENQSIEEIIQQMDQNKTDH